MAIVTKIKDGDDQPNGGAGIVSMSSKGLSAADKIGADVSISPFPPHTAGQLDNSNDVTNAALNHKFDSENVNFAPIGLALLQVEASKWWTMWLLQKKQLRLSF